MFGTYFFQEIHYCNSGEYLLVGQSRKQTVLGNEQVNNWQEAGSWEVIRSGGRVGVRYKAVMGQPNFVPVTLLPDESISIGSGVSIQRQGPAACR